MFVWGYLSSDTFGVDDLRAFNELLPVPFSGVAMKCKPECAECDLSFLTQMTGLYFRNVNHCTLSLPTNIGELLLDEDVTHVTVLGTDNLTHLSVRSESITTTPCPKLQELHWYGEVFSEQRLFLFNNTTPSDSSAVVDGIQPDFRFPEGLTSLTLEIQDESVDIALLTPLTRLQRLDILVLYGSDPLDLSRLTALTRLQASQSSVQTLPTSLVECEVLLESDTDLSPLTNLTQLTLSVQSGIRVTFPTRLKSLRVEEGKLGETNIGDLALETFSSAWGRPITLEELETLPKTLRDVYGPFEPDTLKKRLPELFPLLK